MLERFLDSAAQIGRTTICVGSGNEGDSSGHVSGNIRDRRSVEWTVGEYEQSVSLQLWKNYSDIFWLTLYSPGGDAAVISEGIDQGKYEVTLEDTRVLVYVGEPAPYSVNQEIYLEFLPSGTLGGSAGAYINSGIWRLELEPVKVVTGAYSLYLPSRDARSARTAFLRPTPQTTFTIPSTASRVITVGAYDSTYGAYADFSGRGYETLDRNLTFTAGYNKPDLAAPGVNILAPSIYGGFAAFTGTSFAAPIVAGAAALLTEWGVVRGNDPFLYGEKIKAYLLQGAQPVSGVEIYPNSLVGWGKLCLSESLPG